MSQFGKKFIVEPESYQLSGAEAQSIASLQPAGFMFRQKNFAGSSYQDWLENFQKLYSELNNLVERDQVIFCIDHEGGRVVRPPEPISRFPFHSHCGEYLREALVAQSTELDSLGINFLLGPVVDLNLNPDNPVIAGRAFSEQVSEVVEYANLVRSVMEQRNVQVCPKHFPGHGATEADSHLELPELVNIDSNELDVYRMISDFPAIMTAHVLYQDIDPDNPATISKKILSDILRNQINFNGLIVSDAIGMEGILSKFQRNLSGTLTLCSQASLDIITVVGPGVSIDDALNMSEALSRQATANDYDSLSRIEEFLSRLSIKEPRELNHAEIDATRELTEQIGDFPCDHDSPGLVD